MTTTELYIGLMSGTSIDGVDAVLVAIKDNKCQLIEQHLEPMPDALMQGLHKLCQPSNTEITQLASIERPLTDIFINACTNLLNKTNYTAQDIVAIGSHGQTIRHYPEQAFTLQIGDANRIAALTNIDTVADFRRKDMALGGQGAPLVPAFHQAVFQHTHINRAIINIGGLANITYLPATTNDAATDSISGYDTGPGNTLLDAWFQLHQPYNKHYDVDGAWAASGDINEALLTQLMTDPYLQRPTPKSTGRELYNLAWLNQQIIASDQNTLLKQDIQRTLTRFTALTLVNEVKALMTTGEVYICGGGAANTLLMQEIQLLLSDYKVKSTAALGVDPDWVEAIAFAWLAKRHIHKQSGNLPAVTGASRKAILGSFYPSF